MKTITVIAAFAAALALVACNTIEGVGKDIKNAGEGLSHTAATTKEKIND